MVRGAHDVCVDSDGLCACIYPWGHPSGWCPGVCGQDAHDVALSVPGHVGGGLGWRGLSGLPPRPSSAGSPGSVEIPKVIKWVHLILNVNLSRGLISWR